jgi:hypothetical protein
MDIPLSAATGGARVALQVISAYRRPHLEIYANLRHRIGPEEVIPTPGRFGSEDDEYRHRPQDVFMEFILVNIGGIRAENIALSMPKCFDVRRVGIQPKEIPIFCGRTLAQLAPGQIFPLLRLDQYELMDYAGGERPKGMHTESLVIEATYDGPAQGLNRLARLPSRIRRRRQYRMRFEFTPSVLEGFDLPAPEYS